MDIENLVCVQLSYRTVEPPNFDGQGVKVRSAVLVLSSTVLEAGRLSRIVSDMCNRLNWEPLLYRSVEPSQKPLNYARVLACLS